MKKSLLMVLISIIAIQYSVAQTENEMIQSDLPYYQIPDYPEEYNAFTVTARVIDGLGFRYYWATEGLTENDLAYKPSEGARSTLETVDHIYGLTITLLNSVKGIPTDFTQDKQELSYEELRKQTLLNIKMASDVAKKGSGTDMDEYKVLFKGANGTNEWPFWNMLNGPLSDAIYHTGQLVTFRRTTGNPKNPNVSVLRGRIRE